MKSSQKDKAPREFKLVKDAVEKGLIIVYTGDGKGKSTAAFGTAVRAIGNSMKVAIVQFIKGAWKTGEEEFFKAHPQHCQMHTMGEGFTWDTKNFDKDVAVAAKAWQKCLEFLNDDEHQLVIFDEINCAMDYNFVNTQDVIEALKNKPADKHVILTGRGAPKELIEIADLVSEMTCLKHPYDQGIKAQRGIEF